MLVPPTITTLARTAQEMSPRTTMPRPRYAIPLPPPHNSSFDGASSTGAKPRSSSHHQEKKTQTLQPAMRLQLSARLRACLLTCTSDSKNKSTPAQERLRKEYRLLKAYTSSPPKIPPAADKGMRVSRAPPPPPPPPDKTITSLPLVRLLEMSTDVCAEIVRREGYPGDSIGDAGKRPGRIFRTKAEHEALRKRQQLRESLAALEEEQFRRMAGSVLVRLESFVPGLTKEDAAGRWRGSVVGERMDSAEVVCRHKDLAKLMGGFAS